MIRAITIIIVLVFATLQGNCQTDSLSLGPEPKEGLHKLVLEYYKIKFTKAQQEVLQHKEIELIYAIDTEGVPVLEVIKGVEDRAIRDSLYLATGRLPGFHPLIVNGEAENSLYFVKFRFPNYRTAENTIVFQDIMRYRQTRYEDFEYIHKSGNRLDILFGGLVNSFLGNPAEYLAFGGGMKVDLIFIGKKGLGGGMVMNFYGNTLKKDYPLNSTREQNSAPPTLLTGIALHKILLEQDRREFNIQFEPCYAIQNVTPPLGNQDRDWVQLRGFSPGIVGNYLLKVGKDKTSLYYGTPTIFNHYLNIHGAVRPLFFNLKEAAGLMLEFGLSYRLGYHFVDEYRLKPKFHNEW